MGKIIELYPESRLQPACETKVDAQRERQREDSHTALLRILECFDRLDAGEASEPMHDLARACYAFFEALLPAAPEEVIRDLAYIVVLYLKKQHLMGKLKVE
jgi:hypothetical protein